MPVGSGIEAVGGRRRRDMVPAQLKRRANGVLQAGGGDYIGNIDAQVYDGLGDDCRNSRYQRLAPHELSSSGHFDQVVGHCRVDHRNTTDI